MIQKTMLCCLLFLSFLNGFTKAYLFQLNGFVQINHEFSNPTVEIRDTNNWKQYYDVLQIEDDGSFQVLFHCRNRLPKTVIFYNNGKVYAKGVFKKEATGVFSLDICQSTIVRQSRKGSDGKYRNTFRGIDLTNCER